MSSYESNEEDSEEVQAAIEHVRTLYEAGTPLFTKAAIKKLAEDLDAFRRGVLKDDKIVLRTLDGDDVDYIIVTCWEDVKEDILHIEYRSFERLTNKRLYQFHNRRFFPLHVLYCQKHEREDCPARTTEDACRELDNAKTEWEQSEHHAQLQRPLASVKLPSSIKKVIGFALGPFSDPYCEWRCRIQHSILMTIHQWASASMDDKMKPQCYVQDPIYSDQERKVLETMGVTVLDDPWGFLEADESSIIISIAPDVPVRQIITDISRPAIIIWDKKWVHERPA
ncbi:hypothetical protein K449DRAFT_389547 [Hypoxylon sp. EC38]|nr:hypothetical protein K449DRAFT_389547 [Hypoxylon sp. EC38]